MAPETRRDVGLALVRHPNSTADQPDDDGAEQSPVTRDPESRFPAPKDDPSRPGDGSEKGDGGAPPSPPRREATVPLSEVTRNVVAGVLVLLLGIVLAAANLAQGSAEMALRLPILAGSLILVAHGVLLLVTANEPRRHDASARKTSAQMLIVLGFWLALATLKFTSSAELIWLAYFSGFVLFTFGWILLVRRPVARSDR